MQGKKCLRVELFNFRKVFKNLEKPKVINDLRNLLRSEILSSKIFVA